MNYCGNGKVTLVPISLKGDVLRVVENVTASFRHDTRYLSSYAIYFQ